MTGRFLLAGIVVAMAARAGAAADAPPEISVRDNPAGAYVVSARFSVAEAPAVVRAVLTDYDRIPRFMPGVESSRVIDRDAGRVRLEQEAVSSFMMFSKRVYLLLDVTEEANAIRFRDRSGRSFTSYDGAWTILDRGGATDIEYSLTAAPAFDVPGFVLRKLLSRNARLMIDRLRAEMRERAAAL
jgi:ribosome-associated toxin RatA of RatAB toxin-antitoxin module